VSKVVNIGLIPKSLFDHDGWNYSKIMKNRYKDCVKIRT